MKLHGLWPARLLCPWDFPGKYARVGCHFLLQGIFPNQGSNLCLLHWQEDSLPLSQLGNTMWENKLGGGDSDGEVFLMSCFRKASLIKKQRSIYHL